VIYEYFGHVTVSPINARRGQGPPQPMDSGNWRIELQHRSDGQAEWLIDT
jgi:hypothetical protein